MSRPGQDDRKASPGCKLEKQGDHSDPSQHCKSELFHAGFECDTDSMLKMVWTVFLSHSNAGTYSYSPSRCGDPQP